VQYRAWQIVSAIVGRLPLRASYVLAAILGTLAYYTWPRGRRSLHRNYERVLRHHPRAYQRSVARRSLVNYCKYLADFIRFPHHTPETVVSYVQPGNHFAQLDETLKSGRGALVVCMHFGNWDLGAGAAAALGYPITVVAESFSDKRLDRMVVDARKRLGMTVLKIERAAPSLIRTLKGNGLLAILIDRPVPDEGVCVEFFGEPVTVPAGAARLALRTGAKVVPTAFARCRPHDQSVTLLADFSIEPAVTGDEAEDVRALTQQIMDAHARFIAAYPDQWYMFREMWRPPLPGRAA